MLTNPQEGEQVKWRWPGRSGGYTYGTVSKVYGDGTARVMDDGHRRFWPEPEDLFPTYSDAEFDLEPVE